MRKKNTKKAIRAMISKPRPKPSKPKRGNRTATNKKKKK